MTKTYIAVIEHVHIPEGAVLEVYTERRETFAEVRKPEGRQRRLPSTRRRWKVLGTKLVLDTGEK